MSFRSVISGREVHELGSIAAACDENSKVDGVSTNVGVIHIDELPTYQRALEGKVDRTRMALEKALGHPISSKQENC